MRISKNGPCFEVHSFDASQHRYLLCQSVDGQEGLLYKSRRSHHLWNCMAKANEHLEKLRSWVT